MADTNPVRRLRFIGDPFDILIVIIYGLSAHFMGGVEDDEPPSKCVKASSGELRGLSNGQFLKEPASCSFRDSMARALNPEGDDKLIGSKGVKKVEFVRIIAEAFYSLGYKKDGEHLEEESGIPFHSSVVSVFMQKVRDGKWDECVALLCNLDIHDENIIEVASFIILQQKFLELLEENKVMDALKTLRIEIAPLSIDNNSIREHSAFVLSPSQHALIGVSGQNLVKLKSRSKLLEELQKLLHPSVMIPERRLLKLVEQALDLQRDACLFHNSSVAETSLYTDH